MAVALVVILCFCAACVSGPSVKNQSVVNNTSAVDVGIVPIVSTSTSAPASYSLEDAVSAVTGDNPNQVNGSSEGLSFYYIQGANVDASGKAERWTFGARNGNSTAMLIYDQTGVARVAWQGGLPEQEIDTAGIVSPADIIRIAYPDNQTITGNLGIQIENGKYTITAPSGSHPMAYIINATTGVLIATHD
jgi:hypothetical protein